MEAQILTIEEKLRQSPVGLVSLDEFKFREAGTVDPALVLEQPNLSLYCLDHPNRRAIFVETPPEVDLSEAPFMYQVQYEAAQRLIALPYKTLHKLAGQVRLDPGRLILIYSVGRCGSTLVSHAFNAAAGVVSLSEPDVFTQLVGLYARGSSDEAEISELVRSCTKIQCAAAQFRGSSAWVLKFRSFVIELGHLFYQHFPEARLIFLYRHFDSWARSVRRTFRLSDPEMQKLLPQLHEFLTGLIPGLAAYSARKKEPLSEADFMTWMWLSAMERGLDLQRQGLPFFPVRYEELKADPRQVIEAMFAYCGVTTGSIERLATILAQDSQAKTFISQAKVRQANQELSPEHLAEMHRLISQISTTITPDFIVPGTFFPI